MIPWEPMHQLLCVQVETRRERVRVGFVAAVASAGASGLLLDEASRGRGGEQVVFVDFRDRLVDLGVATG